MLQKEFLVHLHETKGGCLLTYNEDIQGGQKRMTSFELPVYIHHFLDGEKRRTGISKNTLVTLVLNSYKNFLDLTRERKE